MFQKVAGGSRGVPFGFQGHFRVLQRVQKCSKGLQVISEALQKCNEVTGSFSGALGGSEAFQRFKGVSGAFQGVPRSVLGCVSRFHGVSETF